MTEPIKVKTVQKIFRETLSGPKVNDNKFHQLEALFRYYGKNGHETRADRTEYLFKKESSKDRYAEDPERLCESGYELIQYGIQAIAAVKAPEGKLLSEILLRTIGERVTKEPWEGLGISKNTYYVKQRAAIERVATIIFGAPRPEEELLLHLFSLADIDGRISLNPTPQNEKWKSRIENVLSEYQTWCACALYAKATPFVCAQEKSWEQTRLCMYLAHEGLHVMKEALRAMLRHPDEKTRTRGRILEKAYFIKKEPEPGIYESMNLSRRTFYREKANAIKAYAESLYAAILREGGMENIFFVLDYKESKENL
jgi:hypothetical protein